MKAGIPAALLALALSAPLVGAQDRRVENRAGGPKCGSGKTPHYFKPGEFPAALERARRENRPLLIKGVAFGMDRLGATNPTKGHW